MLEDKVLFKMSLQIVFRPKWRPPHFRASNYETISIIRSLVLLSRCRGLLYYIYIQIPHTHTLTHLHYTHNRHLLLPVSSGLLLDLAFSVT